MTILIKGMEMPKSCDECELCDNLGMCILLGEDLFEYLSKEIAKAEPVRFFPDNWKCNDCPLIEVPTPHGRLTMDEHIKRETAIRVICDCCAVCADIECCDYAKGSYGGCKEIEGLRAIPAADVVEVVRCKDCKHRPYSTEPDKTYGLTIEAPDGMCPCYNEDDGWYSWVPDNEFFCSYGERKEGET